MQGQTHATNKTETLRRELPAHGERIGVSPKDRWTLDSVKGSTELTASKDFAIFSQGEAADAVFYIQAGTVKLTVVSPQGKDAVVAILERGDRGSLHQRVSRCSSTGDQTGKGQ